MELNNIEFILEDIEELELNIDNAVVKEYPKLEDLKVTPLTQKQTFKSDNFYGYDTVEVEAVTNEIDSNIVSENIKKDIEILGVAGSLEEINTTETTITPKENEQVITPEEPYNGFSKVIVKAQNGVDIDEYFKNPTSTNYIYNTITKLPTKIYEYLNGKTSYQNTFYSLGGLLEIEDFDTSKGTSMNSMFYECKSLKKASINTDSAKTLVSMFSSCSNIEEITLTDCSFVTYLSGMFSGCSSLKRINGMQNIGKSFSTTQSENSYACEIGLTTTTVFEVESAINLLNNLYDIASIGVAKQRVRFNSIVLSKIKAIEEGTQAIANAEAKGWTVST